MDFLPEDISQYSLEHTEKEPQVLQDLYRETWQKVLMPRMLSGPLQGRVLSMFSKMMQPTRVLEIGAYTGYSALCFAEGLAEDGEVHSIEINKELNVIQDKYWKLAKMENRIKRFNGAALDILPELNDSYDIIFMDADKENYPEYYEHTLRLLRSGGMLLVDNVLWSGKVTSEVKKHDPETKALQELNRIITEDDRVSNVLLPIRDGIMMAMKK